MHNSNQKTTSAGVQDLKSCVEKMESTLAEIKSAINDLGTQVTASTSKLEGLEATNLRYLFMVIFPGYHSCTHILPHHQVFILFGLIPSKCFKLLFLRLSDIT